MTAPAQLPSFARMFRLLAVLGVAALAACSPNATPALLDTAAPPPSATVGPTATRPAATSTPTDEPTEAASATATEAAASATPTGEPSATATATEATTATATVPAATATSSQTIFTAPSIWDIASTVDTSNCATSFNPPYGLVQITPTEGGLQWHNTVPEDYNFTEIGEGVYSYSGPNGIGTGTVALQVTFTSDTTLTLAQTYTASAEPECAHVYTQTGTFQYFR